MAKFKLERVEAYSYSSYGLERLRTQLNGLIGNVNNKAHKPKELVGKLHL